MSINTNAILYAVEALLGFVALILPVFISACGVICFCLIVCCLVAYYTKECLEKDEEVGVDQKIVSSLPQKVKDAEKGTGACGTNRGRSIRNTNDSHVDLPNSLINDLSYNFML